MITSSVVFDHRGRAGKSKMGPVEVRVTIDRKVFYILTGVKIYKNEFMAGSIVNRMDADVLNRRVQIIHNKVMDLVNDCLENCTPIDMDAIRQQVWNMKESKRDMSMIEWLERQVELLRHQPGTMKHYHTLLLRLREYGRMTRWGDVSVDGIYKLDAWLHQLRGRSGRLISDASVYNYHKCLKALLYRAMQEGILKETPYDKLRGSIRRGDRETVEYLTEEEMHRIEDLQLPPCSLMERARDLFVFQMYTGLSYSDAQAFDIRNYRLVDGMYTAVAERVKTGVAYVSSLLPPAVAVLERYGMKVPSISNSEYNRALKAIGVRCGIASSLHSHMARHTFATWMLSNKVALDSVSVMMGHTNTVQTRRYAKTLAQTVRNDFEEVAKKIASRTSQSGKQKNNK